MLKILALMFIFSQAGLASTETCPDFYRFVDFGQKGNDGAVYRGGNLFRVESFDGAELIQSGRTECLAVRDTSKDGHGNPIPVVTSIHYNPKMTPMALTDLQLRAVDDANTVADKNAERHRIGLKQSASVITRGSNFLCVSEKGQQLLSCQVVSPYSGNIPLVVYCDQLRCNMPVMAVDKQVVVNASWSHDLTPVERPNHTGSNVEDMIRKIHKFLSPLSSLNPG